MATTQDQSVIAHQRLQSSMVGLVKDTRFRDFIDAIRQQREMAIDNLCEGAVISNERATLACIGEIASCNSIIRLYDEAMNRAAEEVQGAVD